MKPTYRIKDWDEHFETAESRKLKSTRWVPMPTKHDGKGYRRITQDNNAVEIFCAWNLIVQVASKMPTRGTLADSDGPLDADDLAAKTGFPSTIFSTALPFLSSEAIGWMSLDQQRRVRVSARVRQNPPESASVQSDSSPEGKGIEGNGIEENRIEEISSAPDFLTSLKTNPAYSHINLDVETNKMRAWLALPGNKGRKLTPRFVLNWLNKIEQPIPVTTNGTNGHKHRYKPNESAEVCTRCFNTGTETTPTGSRVCDHKEPA